MKRLYRTKHPKIAPIVYQEIFDRLKDDELDESLMDALQRILKRSYGLYLGSCDWDIKNFKRCVLGNETERCRPSEQVVSLQIVRRFFW